MRGTLVLVFGVPTARSSIFEERATEIARFHAAGFAMTVA